MSDASQREWRFYLDDRIDFTGKGVACTDGLDLAGSVASGRQHRSANGVWATPCSVGFLHQPNLARYRRSECNGRVKTMGTFRPRRSHHAMVGPPAAGKPT